MKKQITILAIVLIGVSSCKKKDATPSSTLPEAYITYNDGTISNTYKVAVFDTYFEAPSSVVNGVPIFTDTIKSYHATTVYPAKGMPTIQLVIKLPRDSSDLQKMKLGNYFTWQPSTSGDDFMFTDPKINNVYDGSRGNLGFYASYLSTESPYVNSTEVSTTSYFNKINKITYINSTWNDLYKKNLPNFFIEGEYKVKINQVGTSNSKTVTGTYKLKFISSQKVK